MNKGYGELLCINYSKQKTEIVKAHVLHHKTYILHVIRERDVRVLDPKGLLSEYMGTQDLDTHKTLNLS
jgi:hypothetical protein